TLVKVAAGSSWGTAGASSVQTFTGAGYAEMIATGGYQMFGLSDVDSDVNYQSIDYAMQLGANSDVWIWDRSTWTYVGTFAYGDTVRGERLSDGHVVFKKNGGVLYTSTLLSTGELRADTSLYANGSVIQGMMI